MSVFVQDSFTRGGGETSPFNIINHTGETGATWTTPSNLTGTIVISPNNEVRSPTGSQYALASGAPGSANYESDGTIKFYTHGTANELGVVVRGAASGTGGVNKTYVWGGWQETGASTGHWVIVTRFNSGTITTNDLGSSPAPTYNATTPGTATIALQISSQTASLYVNGSFVGSATVDSNISATGQAGIWASATSTADATGMHLASFQAQTLSVATTYTLTGPSSGFVTQPSSNFTIAPNGTFSGTITPASSGAGTFTPSSLTWSGDAAPKTFTYTASSTSGSPHSISATNSGSLTNPAAVSYTVNPYVALTSPVSYHVFQRNRTTNLGGIAIAGTFTGISGSHDIEASFNGGAYATIATASTGSFSGTLNAAPGQGTLTVRLKDATSALQTVTMVGVGEVILCVGQSNMSGRGTNNQSPTATNAGILVACLFGNDYVYKPLADPYDSSANQVDTISSDAGATGSYAVILAGMIQGALAMPVMLIPAPLGGTSIISGGSTPYWFVPTNHQDRTTLYGSATYRALQAGGVGAIIWHQGETDETNNQATYLANLQTISLAWQADLGQKMMNCKLQHQANSSEATINATIGQSWSLGYCLQGPDLSNIDVTVTGDDGLHIKTDGQLLLAATQWYLAMQNGIYHPVSSAAPVTSVNLAGGMQ